MEHASTRNNTKDYREATGQLRDKAVEMGSHIKERASEVGSQLRDEAMQIGDDVREIGSIAKDAAQQQFSDLQKAGLEQSEQLLKSIKKNPVSSVCIATAAGFLVGLLLTRK